MAYAWQSWLSARPSPSNVATRPFAEGLEGAIKYEFFVEEDGRYTVQETHRIDNSIVREGKSGPPLHIHPRQLESFQVIQGVLGIVRNGKDVAVSKDDGPVRIPPGVRHTFWAHASSTEDLVFRCWVKPGPEDGVDHGLDESFLRNFAGYLSDCERSKMAPSIFQILLFLSDADVFLTPPFYVPIFLLRTVQYFFAYGVGKTLLGYRETYPEYASPRSSKSAGMHKKGL